MLLLKMLPSLKGKKREEEGEKKHSRYFFTLVQVAKFQCIDHLLYPSKAINLFSNCTKRVYIYDSVWRSLHVQIIIVSSLQAPPFPAVFLPSLTD